MVVGRGAHCLYDVISTHEHWKKMEVLKEIQAFDRCFSSQWIFGSFYKQAFCIVGARSTWRRRFVAQFCIKSLKLIPRSSPTTKIRRIWWRTRFFGSRGPETTKNHRKTILRVFSLLLVPLALTWLLGPGPLALCGIFGFSSPSTLGPYNISCVLVSQTLTLPDISEFPQNKIPTNWRITCLSKKRCVELTTGLTKSYF